MWHGFTLLLPEGKALDVRGKGTLHGVLESYIVDRSVAASSPPYRGA
jgi:hypothetical protein